MLNKVEAMQIEQSLFKNKEEMDAYIMNDFTNLHDLNARVGKTLNKLDFDGKISFGYSTDFKFSKEVSRLAHAYSINNPPSGKAMDLREAAIYFATLADAFEILEKQTEH